MDNNSITVTPAKPAHFKALAKLSLDTLTDFWNVRHFEKELENPFSKTLVALKSNTPIGYLVGHIADNGIIQSFAVSKSYQQKGVGGKLFNCFLEYCRRAKVKTITLDVRVSNKQAIAFYKSRGFQIAHTAKDFYRAPTEDAHLLLYNLPQGENHNAE